MRAKLYLLERTVRSRQCKKRRCEVCTNVTEAYTFSCTVTGETFQINHKLNCDDKYLNYLLKCKVWEKQHVGETTSTFRFRWKNYKDNDRSENCMRQHLYEYFNSEGHNGFLGNVFVGLIDKTDGFQPKKRGTYWMRTLKTLPALGPNVGSTT